MIRVFRFASTAAGMIVLLVGTIILFVGGGARFSVGLSLTFIEHELGTGRTLFGIAVALFQVVSAGAMFWSGRIADKTDPSKVLAIGVAIAGLGLGATSLISAPWQLVVLYGIVFALGNGIASLIPVGVLINRHYPDRAGLANALALTGMATGQLIMILGLNAVLLGSGWRSVFLWLGLAHIATVPLALALMGRTPAHPPPPKSTAAIASDAETTVSAALRSRRFWLLLALYALCGFEDFFVSTHIVAFAKDQGANALLAGNLLAYMGLTALVGVLVSGWSADRWGPVAPTLASFAIRIALFALVLIDQRPASVAIFALAFGATFLMTAPLTVVFVRDAFGGRNLGALTGLITMVHHICGGLGALLGGALFDSNGSYDAVLWLMLASSVLATGLTVGLGSLRRPAPTNSTVE
jgi:MFS family permease